tara:strand:+ start:400 stop:1734 length:1335 start_codon:yes stop_codon:yes gene_type:complete
MKDIFILDSAGAETLYYVKTFGVTPMVIIYTLVYNSLSNVFGRHGLFYIVISYFVAFFALFAFVLYPARNYLALHSFFDYAISVAPNLFGLWGAIRYWFFSLFYIHAELWGTFGMSIAIWTFINEITSVAQSKRFYSFLALGPNVALLFSAAFLRMFGSRETMLYLVYIVLVSGAAIMFIYKWFTDKIAADPDAYQIEEKKDKKKKPKLGLVESFMFLARSKYLGLIAVLVFSYGFVISLIEAVWKSQVKALQKASGGDFQTLSNIYSAEVFLIGITSIILILFASSWIIRKSWKLAALLTPLIASILGAIFFTFMLFGRDLAIFETTFGVSSLFLAVMVGMLQVVFIKAFKYTLFDPTKEAVYIPLDQETKIKGKAAVDGAGGRLGKSLGASLLSMFLLPLFGGKIEAVIPYLLFIIGGALLIWIYAVSRLDVEFKKISGESK